MTKSNLKQIISRNEITVRFSDVDSMGIVWHGNYVKYFEDGREAFGLEHGIHYLDVYKNGFVTPIVKLVCDYKQPLRYGEKAIIETVYVDCEAAKIIHKYTIYRSTNKEIVCTGESIQVFLNTNGELNLNCPSFFLEWKKKMGLID